MGDQVILDGRKEHAGGLIGSPQGQVNMFIEQFVTGDAVGRAAGESGGEIHEPETRDAGGRPGGV